MERLRQDLLTAPAPRVTVYQVVTPHPSPGAPSEYSGKSPQDSVRPAFQVGLLCDARVQALNKRMAGYMSGRGHESMFSGHEVKTTVSISVLNSRKTTVNSFVPRRKHDVDEELINDD